ncbi:MAG: hypothetical protein Q4D24_12860 [Erysipelotrichaceae bacterium]|nr:hypothetical protein [Erysipelotrichaceae bacterium]
MWRRILRGATAAAALAAVAYLSTKDDQVLCNTPEVYFAITGFDHEETGFYTFVRLRNKTGKRMIFRCVRPSVLGYSVPVDFTQEVGPHETVTGNFWINIEFMKRYGIKAVDELSFWLEVTEPSSGRTLINAKYSLSPTGKAGYQLTYPPTKHTDTETVFADNEDLYFTVLGWRITDTGTFVVDVLTKNRTKDVLHTEWSDVIVNGKLPKQMIVLEQEMDPGIINAAALPLFNNFFKENGLKMCVGEEGIRDIAFTFRAFTKENKTLVCEKQVLWTLPGEPDGLNV